MTNELQPVIIKPEYKENKLYVHAQKVKMGAIGNEYIYCLEEGKFYIYSNGYWKPIFDLEVLGNICERIPMINKYTTHEKNQIITHLRLLTRIRLEVFNNTPLINFSIGMFDPINREKRDHEARDYSTFRMPYKYNVEAVCPLWIKSLGEILQNNPKKIEMVQEFFGYCLIPDVSFKKALLFLGESNCGKSTILFILRAMMGDHNCSSVPLKYLSHPQYTPMMVNKLVNIDADVSKNAQDYEADFKIITSGEPVNCNQKFIKAFEFTPKCRIVLAANIFPKITDHSSAFYNRLILIPCEKVFKESEQDRALASKIKQELPGIFNWALDGLDRLRTRGMFEENDFMRNAVKELEDENNPSNVFFDHCIELDMEGDVYIEKDVLYKHFVDWAKRNGQFTLSSVRFNQAVQKRYNGKTEKNTQIYATGKRVWKNIKYIGTDQHYTKGESIQWKED